LGGVHRSTGTRADQGEAAGARDARRPSLRELGLHLSPTGRHLSIATDDERVERYVRTSYALAHVPSVPASADRAVIVTATRPATVTFNGDPMPRPKSAAPSDPLNSGVYLVDQFLWRSLARDDTWLSIYGCAVALHGRTVVLVGPSGTGKTTLALALRRYGGCLYGDEMTVVHRRDATATAIGRRLAVRERSLALLGDERLSAVVRAGERYADGTGDTYYVCRRVLDAKVGTAPPLPLGALVVLRRGDGATRLRTLSKAHAALAAAPYLGSRPGDLSEVGALGALLRDAAAFELSVADPHPGAALIAATVA
jgi:hypothetical protein